MVEMKGSDVLIVIAEVSVAFAGFAGIVAVFRQRDLVEWAPLDAARFRFMVECSLMTVLFALLPFVFHHLGASPTATWSACSGLMAAAVAGLLTIASLRMRRVRSQTPGFNAALMRCMQAVSLLTIALLVLNALRIGFTAEFGPYLAALAWLLVASGINFFRLLLFGVGGNRSIRE
jgi:branched-subunit amino acid transport protein AzlD